MRFEKTWWEAVQAYSRFLRRMAPANCSEGGHELFDLACRSLGSTKGEASAFYTYWRQRLATTNIRGVAKTILQRVPFCTGEHFPMTPHHFGTIHMGPIPAPARSTFPIDIPNHEHGRIDEDDDTEEEEL